MRMHNKGTYTRVLTYAYTRIDIRVYAKYERIIRVCVVRIYLSCTVNVMKPEVSAFMAIKNAFMGFSRHFHGIFMKKRFIVIDHL